MLRPAFVLASLLCLSAPSAAAAEGGARAGLNISLSIPEVCEFHASPVTLGAGGQAVVSVYEMCNSGRTFRIIANHRPLLAGENVRVSYADQSSQLSASGTSDVALRSGPMARTVRVSFQSDELAGDIAISLGMTAI